MLRSVPYKLHVFNRKFEVCPLVFITHGTRFLVIIRDNRRNIEAHLNSECTITVQVRVAEETSVLFRVPPNFCHAAVHTATP